MWWLWDPAQVILFETFLGHPVGQKHQKDINGSTLWKLWILNIKVHLRSKENWFLCALIEDRTLGGKDQLVFDYFHQRFRVCVVVEKHCSPITETAFPQDSWKGGVLEYVLWTLLIAMYIRSNTDQCISNWVELKTTTIGCSFDQGESKSEAWLHQSLNATYFDVFVSTFPDFVKEFLLKILSSAWSPELRLFHPKPMSSSQAREIEIWAIPLANSVSHIPERAVKIGNVAEPFHNWTN